MGQDWKAQCTGNVVFRLEKNFDQKHVSRLVAKTREDAVRETVLMQRPLNPRGGPDLYWKAQEGLSASCADANASARKAILNVLSSQGSFERSDHWQICK